MRNLFKKSILLALFLVTVQLAGCGASANYPVIEAVDTGSLTLNTIENSVVRYSYPADEWTQIAVTPLQISYNETINTNTAVNINVAQASTIRFTGKLTDKIMEDFLDAASTELGNSITVNVSEMRLLNDEPVIYVEQTTRVTDEMIDLLIAAGAYTEELIESMGGREMLLAMPSATQIAIYVLKDQYCYVCTGTYYEESQRQPVLDALTIIISTMGRP